MTKMANGYARRHVVRPMALNPGTRPGRVLASISTREVILVATGRPLFVDQEEHRQ
jgi:hypothetical protein